MPPSPFATELDEGADPLVPLRLDLLGPDGRAIGAWGGTWDREHKRWAPAEAGRRAEQLHAGQVPGARWFAAWEATPPEDRTIFTLFLWGGRAGGKTFLGTRLCVAYAAAYPGAIVWVVNPTMLAGEECRRELEACMPAGWYRREDVGNDEIRYHLRNGSLIRLRSGVRPDTLASGRVDCCLINEGGRQSRKVYDNIRPRIADRGGLVIVATNPAESERGRWVEKYRDEIEHKEVAAISFSMSVFDNPHTNHTAIRARQSELSEDEWRAEAYGETRPIGDVALRAWRRERNFADVPAHLVNCTREVTQRIYGDAQPYVVGWDFQTHPYCVAAVQQYWRDPADPAFVMAWVIDYATGADEHELIREVEDLGYDGDTCICVPDASARYQDGKHDATKGNPSNKILREHGWRRIHMPVPGSTKNPDVIPRVRGINALLRAADGRSRLFVARAGLSEVAEALERLPLKHGKPDGRSKYSHIYDAIAYPAFRFYRAMVVSS